MTTYLTDASKPLENDIYLCMPHYLYPYNDEEK